jgi:hypothetical protein
MPGVGSTVENSRTFSKRGISKTGNPAGIPAFSSGIGIRYEVPGTRYLRPGT